MTPREMTFYEVLRMVDLFNELEPPQLRKVAKITTQLEFVPDEIIYREGELGKGLYIIREGNVCVEMDIPDHGLVTLYNLGPGQLFGWSALIPGRRKKARARATNPTKVLFIDANDIRNLSRLDHKVDRALMNCVIQVMAERLYATREGLARRSSS
ncbi:MAG: hypothetical protein FOGNACKC_06165 [Anaerolineae bacterium]|nr:hypothetical protein [Anaerolineae bacterium]